MGKKSKVHKTKQDKYYHLAKEQGYRSRAAFKLIQLNKTYEFLGKSRALLDLCAAPGGWLQVAAKFMPVSSLIIGVDIAPIKPIRGAVCIQEDITTQRCRTLLKKECQSWKLDTVLNDGSPNVGGATWLKDAYGQNELVLHGLKLATEFLRPGGNYITKVFRSQDYNSLLWVMKQFFKSVDVTKPPASRNTSAEIYVICQGFIAPKSIDPRLLDPAHVFKHVDMPKKNVDVFSKKEKAKPRQRSGYDTEKLLIHSSVPVADFVNAKEPISVLGACSELVFDEASAVYATHSATTPEIRTLCADLKVLGKRDFKSLMQWRTALRKYQRELLKEEKKDQEALEPVEAPTAEESEIIDNAKVDEALRKLAERKLKQEKRQKSKRREKKNKLQRKMDVGMLNADGVVETSEEQGLFTLGAIPDADGLDALEKEADIDIDDVLSGSDGEFGSPVDSEAESADEDNEQHYDRLEKDLESMYAQYKERRNIVSKKQREKLGLDDDNDEETVQKLEDFAQTYASEDEEPTEDKHENPLIVPIDANAGPTAKERANRWFSRDVFADIDAPAATDSSVLTKRTRQQAFDADDDDDEEEDGEGQDEDGQEMSDDEGDDEQDGEDDQDDDDLTERKVPASGSKAAGARGKAGDSEAQKMEMKDSDSESDSDSDSEEDEDVRRMRKQKRKREKEGAFDEVPTVDLGDYSDDSDARAEVLAMGTMMLRKKKRDAVVDAAYNRYSWNDGEDLPEWFADEEARHNKRNLPVTKDMVDQFKMQLKAINARPVKKIAEAKARKKMKTQKRWEKLKNQATQISQSEGMEPGQKLQAIEKLYKKGGLHKKEKVERVYSVVKKNGTVGAGKPGKKKGTRIVKVDARLKKDKRGAKIRARKGKSGPMKKRRKTGV